MVIQPRNYNEAIPNKFIKKDPGHYAGAPSITL